MKSIKHVIDKMMAREARRKNLRFWSVQKYREIENKPNPLYLVVAQSLLESSINCNLWCKLVVSKTILVGH